MKIAEMFYSVQGEGALVGMPSVFVRTSGCNLRCAWCDTPYTSWQPEGEELDLDQIMAAARRLPAPARVRRGHGRRADDRLRDRAAYRETPRGGAAHHRGDGRHGVRPGGVRP